MSGRGLRDRLAVVVAAMVAVLATGALGVIHRQAEHPHGAAVVAEHVHAHDCDGHHEHPESPALPSDHDHDEGGCELCLMLLAAAQWGVPPLGEALGLVPLSEPAPMSAQVAHEALALRALTARGPPAPGA